MRWWTWKVSVQPDYLWLSHSHALASCSRSLSIVERNMLLSEAEMAGNSKVWTTASRLKQSSKVVIMRKRSSL